LDEVDLRLSGLMVRAQRGEREPYHALLAEVARRVRAYVRRRVGEPEAVEDIVQDVLLSIHRNRHTYDPARAFCPWMYAIARHRTLDCLKAQRRRGRHELRGDPQLEERAAPEPNPEHAGLLPQALLLLSDAQSEVIRLLKLEGYSVAEIATKTGRSETSIKVTAHRGYKRLRKLLTGADDED
jgi:RNA polymerase sigma-70 factor (ECF subfamily)